MHKHCAKPGLDGPWGNERSDERARSGMRVCRPTVVGIAVDPLFSMQSMR